MRHLIATAVLMTVFAGHAAAANLFDVAASTKPWVRASILCIPHQPARAVLTPGVGFAIADKTSGTIQYRIVIGDSNQFEVGITRALW